LLRSKRASRGAKRCQWWCRSRAQKAGPRKFRTCRLGLKYRRRDVWVFEIPSKALRCSPSAVWLSPDIPEEVQMQLQVKRQRQADLARIDGPVVGRQSSVVSRTFVSFLLTTEDRRLITICCTTPQSTARSPAG